MKKYVLFWVVICGIVFANSHILYAQKAENSSLAELYQTYQQKNYEATIQLGQTKIGQLDTATQAKELQQIYALMAESYQQLHQPKQYLAYLKLSQQQQEKALALEKKNILLQFENDQKIKEKDKEVKRLERDAINKNEQLRSQQIQIIFAVIGLLVLSALSVGLYQNMKQKAKIQHQLEQKNAEIESQNQLILQKQQDLAKMNQNKNQLFTTISKDIRMPISELKDVLKVFREQNLPPEKIVELAPQLLDNVDEVAETVDNLLKWSLREMKGDSPTLMSLDFIDIANEVLSGLDSVALHKQVKLLDKIDPRMKVYADRNQVFTILRNLLSFAVKRTPTGGEVEMLAFVQDNHIQVQISDAAPTLTEVEINELFNLSLNANRRNAASGLAIAMTLCKTYIENYQSKLNIQHNENQGNLYTFHLPLSAQ